MAGRDPSPFLQKTREKYPEKRIEIWFEDETRYGQKGRIIGVWAPRGMRPEVKYHGGFSNAYIFGSVNPVTGKHIGTIFSECSTQVMNIHLQMVSSVVTKDVHIVYILDRAGWHISKELVKPDNISFLHLPPYSPELNPVERLWLWLKDRYLSNIIYSNVNDLLQKGAKAFQKLEENIVKSVCKVTYVEQYI